MQVRSLPETLLAEGEGVINLKPLQHIGNVTQYVTRHRPRNFFSVNSNGVERSVRRLGIEI